MGKGHYFLYSHVGSLYNCILIDYQLLFVWKAHLWLHLDFLFQVNFQTQRSQTTSFKSILKPICFLWNFLYFKTSMHLFLFDLYFVFSGSSVYPFSFSSLCKALRNFCFEKCCINKVYPHAITDSVISSHKPKLSQFLSVSVACCVRCYTSKVHF